MGDHKMSRKSTKTTSETRCPITAADAGSARMAAEYGELRRMAKLHVSHREPSVLAVLFGGLSNGESDPLDGVLGGIEMESGSLADALCDTGSDLSGGATMLDFRIGAAMKLRSAEHAWRHRRATAALEALATLEALKPGTPLPADVLATIRDALHELGDVKTEAERRRLLGLVPQAPGVETGDSP